MRVSQHPLQAPSTSLRGDEVPVSDCPPAESSLSGQIFDIKRFSTHDGPGIRTAVFFTRCPLRCAWCHNPEAYALCGIDDDEVAGKIRDVSVGELIKEVERDITYFDQSGGGVTVSGGEPLGQPDFIREFLTACRRRDLHATVDTSGSVPAEAIDMAADLADLILYDIKSIDSDTHREWTGCGNEVVLANLERLDARDVPIWIRLPMIPGVNDSESALGKTIAFLKNTRFRRVSILPYHDIGEGKYPKLGLDYRMTGLEPHPPERIEEIRSLFAAAGFDSHVGF